MARKPLARWQGVLTENLPLPLAWVIVCVLYLAGSAIGTIASDAWSEYLTWQRTRKYGRLKGVISMPSKTYRPKSGNEGLQVEAAIERRVVGYDDNGVPQFDRDEGETFSVTSWPYTTENDAEQAYLDTLDALTDQAAPAKKSGGAAGDSGGGS